MSLPPPPDWSRLLRSGQRLYVSGGAAFPAALVADLTPHLQGLGEVEVLHSRLPTPAPWQEAPWVDSARANTFVLDAATSAQVNDGALDYTPAHASDIPALLREGALHVSLALVSVTPPDAFGYCSLGPTVELTPTALDRATFAIAQINPALPRCGVGATVRLDRFHAAIEAVTPPPAWQLATPDATAQAIACHIALLIDDGDTVSAAFGPLGEAIYAALAHHQRLGFHGEVLTPGVQRLFVGGQFTNAHKALVPGRLVAALALGDADLYQFLDGNPHVDLRPTEFVNAPTTMARLDNLVFAGEAQAVDLTGQAALDGIDTHISGGIGGQVDFLRGAAMSRGGRPILALPSTMIGAEGQRISRIRAQLPAGAGVGINRADVAYIVTEFGVASLRGRTIAERVLEMVAIAHPDFREELLADARAHHLVPAFLSLNPAPPPEEATRPPEKIRLKDGIDYILRPLTPADDRRLQTFFYSHTEETISRRYGFSLSRMTRERASELVGVDQVRDVAWALIERRGAQQQIHAVGRYYADAQGQGAEVAFVVSERKRRLGIAQLLLKTLQARARAQGLEHLWAQVEVTNQPMRRLFQGAGGVEDAPEDGQVFVRLPIE